MTGTELKILALVCMLLDHIWKFIPGMPYFFHWIGRISAPIFIFCCILGFENTINKKKYIIRVYFFSVFMAGINYMLHININFIRTIFLTLICILIIYLLETKHKNAKLCLIGFIIWQIITSIAIIMLILYTPITEDFTYLIINILGNILNLEGGITFIILGILMYKYRDKKNKLIYSSIILVMIYIGLFNTNILPNTLSFIDYYISALHVWFTSSFNMLFGIHPILTPKNMLFDNPQWMMIFSLPFIFKYNGERGKNLKYLFYVFYPVHIVTLYLIGINIG